MNTQQTKLNPLHTISLLAALQGGVKPTKATKATKAVKADKVKKPESVKVLALPAPSKGKGKNKPKLGVFAGVDINYGSKLVTVKPPLKPTNEQREAVLNGLGVNGNPIKQVAKRCSGLTSAATIWHYIDGYRAAHNTLPTVDIIDNAALMCVKRGELFESRVKKSNISAEIWAYKCYYQLGGATRKAGQKAANSGLANALIEASLAVKV
jgi:hypothetical protein